MTIALYIFCCNTRLGSVLTTCMLSSLSYILLNFVRSHHSLKPHCQLFGKATGQTQTNIYIYIFFFQSDFLSMVSALRLFYCFSCFALKFPFGTRELNFVVFSGFLLLQNDVAKLALSFLTTADTCMLPVDCPSKLEL